MAAPADAKKATDSQQEQARLRAEGAWSGGSCLVEVRSFISVVSCNLGLMTRGAGNKLLELDEINEAVTATKKKMMDNQPQIYLYLLRADVPTWCASCLHRFLDISVSAVA